MNTTILTLNHANHITYQAAADRVVNDWAAQLCAAMDNTLIASSHGM